MKIKLKLPATSHALIFICSLFTLPSAFGQGALTPPGPPAATMVTLSQLQLQSRTPISSVPITITQPGSYYLVSNLVCTVSNAIVITANGVTLDLNGFTLSSTVANAANGGAAILLNTSLTISDITICNGHIVGGVTNNGSNVYSGSGFGYGIYCPGFSPVNVLVSHVTVSGCLDDGIYVYNEIGSTLVESCTVSTIGNYGIAAYTVNQSSAIDCAEDAIYSNQASDCVGESTFHGYGIDAIYQARDCYGYTALGYAGINASVAHDCYGYNAGSNYGIFADFALNCDGTSGTGDGVWADDAENSFGDSSGSGYGLYAQYTASGCSGASYSGTGLDAFIASVCHGISNTGTPLAATHNVNSY
ncbi:MAG TPA: hypothetical protein VGY56_15610 [Verrucomicrobiae bacterium]|nr:hypothetical protein [Verrucomicrobiae bacterium]